jgi:hypothetical protein
VEAIELIVDGRYLMAVVYADRRVRCAVKPLTPSAIRPRHASFRASTLLLQNQQNIGDAFATVRLKGQAHWSDNGQPMV